MHPAIHQDTPLTLRHPTIPQHTLREPKTPHYTTLMLQISMKVMVDGIPLISPPFYSKTLHSTPRHPTIPEDISLYPKTPDYTPRHPTKP